jgi:hypothetical protein
VNAVVKKGMYAVQAMALAFFQLVLLTGASAVLCNSQNTPIIDYTVANFLLFEGRNFSHDFNTSNMQEQLVTYNHLLLTGPATGLGFSSNGVLTLDPGREDAGASIIALLAYKGPCLGTFTVNLTVIPKPVIYDFMPGDTIFGINKTGQYKFNIKTKSSEGQDKINYAWVFNNEIVQSGASDEFMLNITSNSSGLYNLTAVATDEMGLSANLTWKFLILKENKPPVLARQLPNLMLFKNTASGAYSLSDYFIDPEGGIMQYSYKSLVPADVYLAENVGLLQVSVNISETGFLYFSPENDKIGRAYFTFTATDMFGAAIESNAVKVDVVPGYTLRNVTSRQFNQYCGDYTCNNDENCTTCQFDCGKCAGDISGCASEWACTEWSECQPLGVQLRACSDLRKCDDNRSMPDVVKACDYSAT